MSAAAVAAIAIGIVLNMRPGRNDPIRNGEDSWICPISSFRLSDEQVSRFESSALLEGDAAVASHLAVYYSLFWQKPALGDVWNYRAAQLGDFGCACALSTEGLLYDLHQIFSDEALTNSVVAAMSDLAREYIRFNYRNCRKMRTDSIVCATNDWSLAAATVRTESVAVRGEDWEIEYAAYKARNRCGKNCETNQVQVLVFSSMPSLDSDEPFDVPPDEVDMSGIACQNAVFMAESNGWPWIVVAVDCENSLIPETFEITDEEKLDCARIALDRVFAEFSLPSSTVVMPAGDILFVDRFKSLIEKDYNVKPAPETLLVYEESDKK